MLLDRSDQAITSTDLSKKTRLLLDQIANGSQDRFVVMRDNRPTAVMLATERYEALMDELEDYRIDALARDRLAQSSNGAVLSRDKMAAFVAGLK